MDSRRERYLRALCSGQNQGFAWFAVCSSTDWVGVGVGVGLAAAEAHGFSSCW